MIKTPTVASFKKRVKTLSVPADLEKWLNNHLNCSAFFTQLGCVLLTEEEILALESPAQLDFKDDATYFAYKEFLKSIVFVAKNMAGRYFGYYVYNEPSILKAPIFMKSQDFFYLEAGTLIEVLMMDLAKEKEPAYNYYKEVLEPYKFQLADYKDLVQYSEAIYDDYGDPDTLLETLKTGRDLSHLAQEISDEAFLEWQNPRFGTENPSPVDSAIWKNCIYSKEDAYLLRSKQNGPISCPVYCFSRFGQSLTRVDGKEIFIAGEHEDAYDPDFYIYNDVVVIHEDNSVEIYNYPKEVFPPTDFHTATLIDPQTILIIGNLGYMKERQEGFTPVYKLNLQNYKIDRVETSGPNPGWIYRHRAILSPDLQSIKILGGVIQSNNNVDNIDEWELNLQNFEWTRLTDKKWKQWEIKRMDAETNYFFNIRSELFNLENPDYSSESRIESLQKILGYPIDVRDINKLYQFEEIPGYKALSAEDEDYNIYKISIDGVTIRFKETHYNIQVRVEGDLEDHIIKTIQSQLLQKASSLENSVYIME